MWLTTGTSTIKLQGIKCSSISASQIQQLDETKSTYLVSSQTEHRVNYLVDMKLGVCSYNAGQDGSPCSHQAATVKHFHIPNVNCIPTYSPETRQQLAVIAVGPSAIQDSSFYFSLHQAAIEFSIRQSGPPFHSDPDSPNFTGTAWDSN